jgi:N-acetylglutamate synthase-like GNAT family acetyltransferase
MANNMSKINLSDITIRTSLQSGDIGYIVYLHGKLYSREYGYGLNFESYVAEGLAEFYKQYDPSRERVWICEHKNSIIGCLLLMSRGEATAQLRYYLLAPDYRGIGLGKKLMNLFIDFLDTSGYSSCYLWTTSELPAAASLYKKFGFVMVEEKPSAAFGKDVVEQKYVREKLV